MLVAQRVILLHNNAVNTQCVNFIRGTTTLALREGSQSAAGGYDQLAGVAAAPDG